MTRYHAVIMSVLVIAAVLVATPTVLTNIQIAETPMCPGFDQQPPEGVTRCLASVGHNLLDGSPMYAGCPPDRLIVSGPRWHWTGELVGEYAVCEPLPS